VKSLKALLPEAKSVFGKRPNSVQSFQETWDAARVVLVAGNQTAQAQLEAAQQMTPENLLFKIEYRLARLENTFMELSDAILTIEKGKEDALGKTIYAVAQKQRESEKAAKQARIEETVAKQKTIEGVTVEKPAPGEPLRVISEAVSGRKDGAEEPGNQFEFESMSELFSSNC
jgi:hypothetical protein